MSGPAMPKSKAWRSDSAPEPALARPPATRQAGRKARLTFLYAPQRQPIRYRVMGKAAPRCPNLRASLRRMGQTTVPFPSI